MPESASIISLRVVSTSVPLVVVGVPRPQAGPKQRPAAVAGTFYPGDPDQLGQMIDGFLDQPPPSRQAWPAALVPHAGLKYSGRLAAQVLQQLDIPETVIVLAPKHSGTGVDWAVAPHETWALPGATVSSDPELARQLSESIDDLQLDAAAHAREHAIEVQLPLLARVAPHARVVGITIGSGNLERCHQFATGLADVLRARDADRALLLISSDMNHYATEEETRRVDQLVLDSMERLDPEDLYRTVRENRISMCGVLPAVIVLEALRQLGHLERCHRVGYTTSAETSGDTSRVVGYAGMLFG
jgi:AmmeMemoRadiSam system protein B